jgi:hypothetical protein
MLQHKEFILALSFSTCIVLIPLFIDLFSFYQTDILSLKPAWFCWGVDGAGYVFGRHSGTIELTPHVIMLLNFFALPLLAPLAYSYSCYDDGKNDILKILIPKTGRAAYHLANVSTAFWGAFFILFLPLILEQLILLIVCPLNTPYIMSSSPAVDDYLLFTKTEPFLAALRLNHPYLFNVLYCVIPAVTGGLLALLSYALSLFFQKSRFLVLTLPGILWIVVSFGLSNLGGMWEITFNHLVEPYGTFYPWAVFAAVLLVIDTVMIGVKLLFAKDELS